MYVQVRRSGGISLFASVKCGNSAGMSFPSFVFLEPVRSDLEAKELFQNTYEYWRVFGLMLSVSHPSVHTCRSWSAAWPLGTF